MLKDIKAVIFDLDGTLVDSMWIWRDIDINYLAKKGYELPENLQKEIEGMSFTETAEYFKNRFNLEDDVETIKSEWNEMAHDYYKNKIPLKKGVREFLQFLISRNIKIGIGTSNSKELAKLVLESNDILKYFDTIRNSCEVDKGKPSPDIFLKVSEDLEVLSSECLVFEDTYAGVLGAKRAGMRVIAIADELSFPYKKEISDLADNYVDDFISIA